MERGGSDSGYPEMSGTEPPPRVAFRHESFMALVKDAAKGFYVPDLDAEVNNRHVAGKTELEEDGGIGGTGAGTSAAAAAAAIGVGAGVAGARSGSSGSSSGSGTGGGGGKAEVEEGAPAGASIGGSSGGGPTGNDEYHGIGRRSGSSNRSLQFLDTGSGSPSSPPHAHAKHQPLELE